MNLNHFFRNNKPWKELVNSLNEILDPTKVQQYHNFFLQFQILYYTFLWKHLYFLYINASPVETPEWYFHECFAGYYFIAHTRKKVILLPSPPLRDRDRLDRALPVLHWGRPLCQAGRSQSGRVGFYVWGLVRRIVILKQPLTNYGRLSPNGVRTRC